MGLQRAVGVGSPEQEFEWVMFLPRRVREKEQINYWGGNGREHLRKRSLEEKACSPESGSRSERPTGQWKDDHGDQGKRKAKSRWTDGDF